MGSKESKPQKVDAQVSSETVDPITCNELKAKFNELGGNSEQNLDIDLIADCLLSFHDDSKANVTKFLRRYSANLGSITENEFLEAFSNYYEKNKQSFSRPRSLSLEELDFRHKPPPELRKGKVVHSKLAPTDRIAEPFGPDTGEQIPAVCKDCGCVYNYARGHKCDAMPSFAFE